MNDLKLALGIAVVTLSISLFGNVSANYIWWNLGNIKGKKKQTIKHIIGYISLFITFILILRLFRLYESIPLK